MILKVFSLCALLLSVSSTVRLSDTTLITNCDGMVRLFPNDDWNANLMFEKLPQLYNDYLDSIARELKTGCKSVSRTDEEWDQLVYERYDIMAALLSPTRYNRSTDFVDLCPGSSLPKYTRDLTAVMKSLIGKTTAVFPKTCTYDSWMEQGSCSIAVSLPEVERTVMTFSALRCPDRGGVRNRYFQFAFACRGVNCETFLQPCNETAHCGSGETCISDLLSYSSYAKDLMYWITEELRVYTGDGKRSSCASPNRFFELLVHRLHSSTGICLPAEETKNSIFDIESVFNLTNYSDKRDDAFSRCQEISNSFGCLHELVLNWTATLTYNAWKVFPYYDTLTAGISVFDHDREWPEWPTLQFPTDSTHILSTDCSGVIYAFLGSPYSFSFFSARLPIVLSVFAEYSMEVWKCERIYQQLDYLAAQALWRIEPYLKIFTDPVVSDRFPSPSLFDDLLSDMGTYTIKDLTLGDWFFGGDLSGTISTGDPNFELALKASSGEKECLENSFVNLHLTCRGSSCDDFLFRTVCNDETDCGSGSDCICLEYDISPVATALWARPKISGNKIGKRSIQEFIDYSKCPYLVEGDEETLTRTNPDVDENAWKGSVYAIWNGLNIAELCSERDNCTGSCELKDGACVQRMRKLQLPDGGTDTNNLWFCYPKIPSSQFTWESKKMSIATSDYTVVEYPLSTPRYVLDTPTPTATTAPSPTTPFRYGTEIGTSFKTSGVVIATIICVLFLGGVFACLTTVLSRRKDTKTDDNEENEELAPEDHPGPYDARSSNQGGSGSGCFPDDTDDDDDTPV